MSRTVLCRRARRRRGCETDTSQPARLLSDYSGESDSGWVRSVEDGAGLGASYGPSGADHGVASRYLDDRRRRGRPLGVLAVHDLVSRTGPVRQATSAADMPGPVRGDARYDVLANLGAAPPQPPSPARQRSLRPHCPAQRGSGGRRVRPRGRAHGGHRGGNARMPTDHAKSAAMSRRHVRAARPAGGRPTPRPTPVKRQGPGGSPGSPGRRGARPACRTAPRTPSPA